MRQYCIIGGHRSYCSRIDRDDYQLLENWHLACLLVMSVFGLSMQSEKRSYSMATGRFNSNARHVSSYRSGSLLSIAIGLVICFVIYLIISHSSLAEGKQEKLQYEKSDVNGAVHFNDKIAVADS